MKNGGGIPEGFFSKAGGVWEPGGDWGSHWKRQSRAVRHACCLVSQNGGQAFSWTTPSEELTVVYMVQQPSDLQNKIAVAVQDAIID